MFPAVSDHLLKNGNPLISKDFLSQGITDLLRTFPCCSRSSGYRDLTSNADTRNAADGMAYRLDGKERTLSLGPYPVVGLRAARDRRDKAKALLAAGKDPGRKKKADKIARGITAATTFESVGEEYLDKLRREARARATVDKVKWLLALAAPKLGKRPIAEISPIEVLSRRLRYADRDEP